MTTHTEEAPATDDQTDVPCYTSPYDSARCAAHKRRRLVYCALGWRERAIDAEQRAVDAERRQSERADDELKSIAARLREIGTLVESSDSYVPQDVAAECLLMLKVVDEPGKPNTLIALVERATSRLAAVTLRCGMCGTPAVCLSVDNEPPERAIFACADCCGCGGCANVHDAENPYCEAETGGCWRLVGIPEYVNSLRDDLNALDETTASRINELEEQLAAANAEIERLRSGISAALFESTGPMGDEWRQEHVREVAMRPMPGDIHQGEQHEISVNRALTEIADLLASTPAAKERS